MASIELKNKYGLPPIILVPSNLIELYVSAIGILSRRGSFLSTLMCGKGGEDSEEGWGCGNGEDSDIETVDLDLIAASGLVEGKEDEEVVADECSVAKATGDEVHQ